MTLQNSHLRLVLKYYYLKSLADIFKALNMLKSNLTVFIMTGRENLLPNLSLICSMNELRCRKRRQR